MAAQAANLIAIWLAMIATSTTVSKTALAVCLFLSRWLCQLRLIYEIVLSSFHSTSLRRLWLDVRQPAASIASMPKTTKPPTYKTGQTAVAQYVGQLDSLDQRSLALWAALCAEHVLPCFEREHPADGRPRRAIEAARAWVRGEIRCGAARAAAVAAHAAARACTHPAATAAARAAGHAAGTAHLPGHARGAAAYAITATAAASPDQLEDAIRFEWQWQMQQLPKRPSFKE